MNTETRRDARRGYAPTNAVELFCLLGGSVFGDAAGLPNSLLAILPGTGYASLVDRSQSSLAIIPALLDLPMSKAR